MEENEMIDYKKKYDEALERAKELHGTVAAGRDFLVEVFPELRESEDERIRRRLINLIKELAANKGAIHTGGYFVDGQDKKYIAYLEKQKEQKPLSTEETELNSLAFLSQMGYTCIPPKKEHQNNSDAPKKALGGALNSPLDKDKNLDDIAQDYVDGVKEYNPEPTWDLMQTAVCYGYHFAEQKPTDWSEEDEKMRINILNALTPQLVYSVGKGTYTGTSMYKYDDEIKWLKSLRPSWKPSEEQEEPEYYQHPV